MAREPNKTDTKKPETGTPLGPNTEPAPLIIQTDKIVPGANVDPRGDNRPGVIPDQPLQEGIDPVTNLREDLVDKETLIPKPVSDQPGGILNPPVVESGAAVPAAKAKAKPKGRTMKIVMERDYWPQNKPDDWSEEDKASKDYRVAVGQEVELPEEEALTVLDRHLGRRADPRA